MAESAKEKSNGYKTLETPNDLKHQMMIKEFLSIGYITSPICVAVGSLSSCGIIMYAISHESCQKTPINTLGSTATRRCPPSACTERRRQEGRTRKLVHRQHHGRTLRHHPQRRSSKRCHSTSTHQRHPAMEMSMTEVALEAVLMYEHGCWR